MVFFQATSDGTDKSIYPRESQSHWSEPLVEGARVKIHSQDYERRTDCPVALELNGVEGGLVSFNASTGRWNVKTLPDSRTDSRTVAIGASHLTRLPREKGRFLILPRQLALHTKAFRMYFVQISESRQNKAQGYSNGNVILQLHLLFVSENHKSIDFCEQKFLLVNKKTFQPFRYDESEQKWKSFDTPSESQAGRSDYPFLGRQVMVNVAIAQDIPIPFKFAMPRQQEPPVQFSSGLKWKFLEEHGGVIEAPLTFYNDSDGSTRKLKLCNRYLKQGMCSFGAACTFDHKRGLLSSLPSWCSHLLEPVVGEGGGGGGGGSGGSGDDSLEVSAETSQASPAASPDRERVVSSNDSNMSDGPWTVVERQSSQAPPAREYRGANTFAVYVEGLPPNFDDNNLKQLFDPFVDISSCKIKAGAIGYSTKIGFVNFKYEQDAETAIQNVNGQQVEGYTIQARHKPPKSR